MARSATEKTSRRAVNSALLKERLGLDDPWIERWQENGVWREKSCAPKQLPQFIREKLNEGELKKVEEFIDQLVVAGCQRSVIYFCLDRLSPASERLRAGDVLKGVQVRQGEDLHSQRQLRRLATREDVAAIAGVARAARKQIDRYKHELSFAAEALGDRRLPVGFSTKPEDPEDALLLLKSALTWAASLAEAYTAPMQSTLMKSKGLLFLTIYIAEHADERKLRSPKSRSVLADGKKASKDNRAKKTHLPAANVLSNLLSMIMEADDSWSPSELKEKAKSFRQDHPRLHKLLCQKLSELHEFARHKNGLCNRISSPPGFS